NRIIKNYFIASIDTNLQTLNWVYRNEEHQTTDNHAASSPMIIDNIGNVYITHRSLPINHTGLHIYHLYMNRINNQGQLIWSSTYTDTDNSSPFPGTSNSLNRALLQ